MVNMPKSEDFSEIGERSSETWNIAQGYTFMKILKPLIEIDKLINIARYGTDNVDESFNIHKDVKIAQRIEAIHRLLDELKKIIDNSQFTMNKTIKEEIEPLEKRLDDIEIVISAISTNKIDHRTGENIIEINENHFTLCMNELRDIKIKLMDALNKASLIFPASDEIDLDKFKNRFIFGG